MSKVSNKDLIKETIKETIQEMNERERQSNRRKVFRNTELLMKNYNVLKQHSENAIYSFNESIELGLMDDVSFDNLYIEAILKSKVRTTIMIQHIDIALEMLRTNSIRKGKLEETKYNVLIDIYVHGNPYDELAEKYSCANRTISRWRNDMLKTLGLLLFGVDGLLSEMAI